MAAQSLARKITPAEVTFFPKKKAFSPVCEQNSVTFSIIL
jgi:hypothetical protein